MSFKTEMTYVDKVETNLFFFQSKSLMIINERKQCQRLNTLEGRSLILTLLLFFILKP